MTTTERNAAESRSSDLQRSISGTNIRAVEGEASRQFDLSFSSEEPYERFWGTEILSHKTGALDLTRLQEIGCLLYNHDRDRVIGRIVSADVINGRGVARVRFDEDAESETIYQKVKSGTLKGVSVGYRVDEWEDIPAGHKNADGIEGPCSIATRWTPFEISIVSIPADATVGVGRARERPEQKEAGCLYFAEKQLQINNNTINKGGEKG